jgi:DNA mismatch repair protein MutS2
MAHQTQKVLEFPQLIKIIQRFAASSLGRRCLANLQPSWEFEEVQTRLQEVDELAELTLVEGACPLEGCPDLTAILKKVMVSGSILLPEDFNQILMVLRVINRVRRYFQGIQERQPLIAQYGQQLRDLTELRQAIQKAISPHGLILDQASGELGRLRQEMQSSRQQISRKLQQLFGQTEIRDVLQDQVISQRNGRYVIPIKADFKGKISGIIHDQSQSKATLFLEPFEIVSLNNSLNLLAGEEKREEERILLQLTNSVRAYLEGLQVNLGVLGEVDALQAKVLYAQEYKARTPVLTRRGRLKLNEARHPLLLHRDKAEKGFQTTIPVELELTPESRFLVLSGANTGGKTVTLKTLGVLCLMAQCGIPLPVAEGSEVCVFEGIFADIGDTQDIAHNLSTFSAHIKRTADILAKARGRCLVLLDELGTATDPAEGGALALAMLKAFGRSGAYGVVTTHYHLLKAFAHEELGFANVAVLFDDQTQKPLYRLAYGVAGPSNALNIARELGLPPDIISEAEQYLGQEGLQALQELARCEAAQQSLAQRDQDLRQAEIRVQRREEEVEQLREDLASERRRILEEERRAITAAIQKAEKEFKEILQRLENREDSWGRLRQEFSAGQRRLQLLVTPPEKATPAKEFKPEPGQKVWITPLGQRGIVVSGPDKEGRQEVQVGAVKLRLAPQDMQATKGSLEEGRVFRGRAKGGVSMAETSEAWQSPTLNIIGLRVDEALPLVDKLLDQAVLHGCREIEIIHGIGTGRLQQAVRQHVRQHSMVKDVRSGEASQGGRGVTVVELKE